MNFSVNSFHFFFNLADALKLSCLQQNPLLVRLWVSLKGIMNCLMLQAVGGVYSWKPDFEEQFTILTQIPNGLSVSHVCPFVLVSPGLLSYWPDLGWEQKECTGAFFSSFLFLMSHSTEQKQKEGWRRKYNGLQPCPPSSASWKHSDITSHTLTV